MKSKEETAFSLKIRNSLKVTTKFSVERPWLTASIAMKECPTETLLKCVSVGTNRDIFQVRGLVRTPQSKRVYARCYRSENCGKHFSNHFLKFSNIFALKKLPGIFLSEYDVVWSVDLNKQFFFFKRI